MKIFQLIHYIEFSHSEQCHSHQDTIQLKSEKNLILFSLMLSCMCSSAAYNNSTVPLDSAGRFHVYTGGWADRVYIQYGGGYGANEVSGGLVGSSQHCFGFVGAFEGSCLFDTQSILTPRFVTEGDRVLVWPEKEMQFTEERSWWGVPIKKVLFFCAV